MGIKYFDFDMVVTVAKVYIKLLDTFQTNAYISAKKLDTSLITNSIYDFNRVQQPLYTVLTNKHITIFSHLGITF